MTADYRAMCAELVDDLEMSDWPSKLKETFRADIARARLLLAEADGPAVPESREPASVALQPVLVSERLPGPEDCDEQGRCWLWERDCGYSGCKWALVDRAWALSQSDEDLSVYTHWLPANALPTPEATND